MKTYDIAMNTEQKPEGRIRSIIRRLSALVKRLYSGKR